MKIFLPSFRIQVTEKKIYYEFFPIKNLILTLSNTTCILLLPRKLFLKKFTRNYYLISRNLTAYKNSLHFTSLIYIHIIYEVICWPNNFYQNKNFFKNFFKFMKKNLISIFYKKKFSKNFKRPNLPQKLKIIKLKKLINDRLTLLSLTFNNQIKKKFRFWHIFIKISTIN